MKSIVSFGGAIKNHTVEVVIIFHSNKTGMFSSAGVLPYGRWMLSVISFGATTKNHTIDADYRIWKEQNGRGKIFGRWVLSSKKVDGVNYFIWSDNNELCG